MTGATAHGLERQLRLDPTNLPARYRAAIGTDDQSAIDASVYLDGSGVIVKRQLSGLPLTLSMPFSAFEGVAVRLVPEGDDGLVAHVELLHSNPELSIPLTVTRHMETAAEDWQSWAKRLGLPMLLVERDGVAERVGPGVSLPIGDPVPRRAHGLTASRRPRFNTRRSVGQSGDMPVYRGSREIISYE